MIPKEVTGLKNSIESCYKCSKSTNFKNMNNESQMKVLHSKIEKAIKGVEFF